uniref:Ig-like domain-containing protein n=1 Tax=Scophthalmus maximus TaxID=52904 RepID=A0A8D3DEW3_SCOMX
SVSWMSNGSDIASFGKAGSQIKEGFESQLKCHADGFYPPPVSFSWTRDGRVIQPPYQVEGEHTSDGYFMAVGNLTFYPSREDQNVTFGCKVSHRGSYQELDFQLNITCE